MRVIEEAGPSVAVSAIVDNDLQNMGCRWLAGNLPRDLRTSASAEFTTSRQPYTITAHAGAGQRWQKRGHHVLKYSRPGSGLRVHWIWRVHILQMQISSRAAKRLDGMLTKPRWGATLTLGGGIWSLRIHSFCASAESPSHKS